MVDADDRRGLEVLRDLEGVISVESNGGPVHVALDDLKRVPDLVASLVERGVRVSRVVPHEPSLEELYFTVRREERERS